VTKQPINDLSFSSKLAIIVVHLVIKLQLYCLVKYASLIPTVYNLPVDDNQTNR